MTSSKVFVVLPPDAFDMDKTLDYYTNVLVKADIPSKVLPFSKTYSSAIQEISNALHAKLSELGRTDRGERQQKAQELQAYEELFGSNPAAEAVLNNARQTLKKNKAALSDKEAQLNEEKKELARAEAELEEKKQEFAVAVKDLPEKRKELEEAKEKLAEAKDEYRQKEEEVDKKLSDAQGMIDDLQEACLFRTVLQNGSGPGKESLSLLPTIISCCVI